MEYGRGVGGIGDAKGVDVVFDSWDTFGVESPLFRGHECIRKF
jgi:hypothetical protein